MAKEVREAPSRGEETGRTPEEIAFYQALADNQSAVDILGNDQLKLIAHELLQGLKANVRIDWAHRDSARARLRVLVRRILRKYGDPPDREDAAVRGVLAQAEAIQAEAVRSTKTGPPSEHPSTSGMMGFGMGARGQSQNTIENQGRVAVRRRLRSNLL